MRPFALPRIFRFFRLAAKKTRVPHTLKLVACIYKPTAERRSFYPVPSRVWDRAAICRKTCVLRVARSLGQPDVKCFHSKTCWSFASGPPRLSSRPRLGSRRRRSGLRTSAFQSRLAGHPARRVFKGLAVTVPSSAPSWRSCFRSPAMLAWRLRPTGGTTLLLTALRRLAPVAAVRKHSAAWVVLISTPRFIHRRPSSLVSVSGDSLGPPLLPAAFRPCSQHCLRFAPPAVFDGPATQATSPALGWMFPCAVPGSSSQSGKPLCDIESRHSAESGLRLLPPFLSRSSLSVGPASDQHCCWSYSGPTAGLDRLALCGASRDWPKDSGSNDSGHLTLALKRLYSRPEIVQGISGAVLRKACA